MHIPHCPVISSSPHYRKLLERAVALGFCPESDRPARRVAIDGLGARGFRKTKLIDMGGGTSCLRAYYGNHLVVRTFEPNPDGSFPYQTILSALCMTADRMDLRAARGAKKKRRKSYTDFERTSSVNEPSTPCQQLRPIAGSQASSASMSANDTCPRFLIAA